MLNYVMRSVVGPIAIHSDVFSLVCWTAIRYPPLYFFFRPLFSLLYA